MNNGSFSLEVMDPDNISNWRDDEELITSENLSNGNIILFDWFSMSSRIDSAESLIRLLGLRDDVKFTESYGLYGYRSRLFFDGISIHFNHWNKEQDYPLLEMSGQGCRDFETYSDGNWARLFECAIDTDNYNITRLDVAYDDYFGLLDIEKIMNETKKRNYVARSQKGTITNSFSKNVDAISVMFGVKSSELYIRFYDKAKERGIVGDKHWIRCEAVLKHDRALNFILNPENLGHKFAGVINNYLRFVTPNTNDVNKCRWSTRSWWNKFIGNVDRISLYTRKDVEYNLSRIGRYVFHQSGNSIETYIKCVGLVKFLEDLKIRDTRLNPHQKRIIEEYKIQCNSHTAEAPGSDLENELQIT